MVRGIKRGARWKKSSIDGRFEKGLIMAKALGYIYTILGLEASLAGLPRASRSIKLARAQAQSSLMRTTEVGLPWARDMESLRQLC
jgi:hypothetical protein